MQELKPNVWSFLHEDSSGTVSTKRFEADTWTEALQQFVVFMKGLEFIIRDDDIQLHRRRADLTCEDWGGDYCGELEDDGPLMFRGEPIFLNLKGF